MKPAPFAYHAPGTLPEALDLLARLGGEAKILAGGQSLIPVMSFRLAQPAALIDVNALAALDYVRMTPAGGLAMGALTRQRRLERDPEVARRAPLLAEAMPYVAHPQIRNRGTLGGSLAHADPAAELPCLALALDARLRLESAARGSRWVAAGDFYQGLFATALAEDEMLVEVEVPPWPAADAPPGERVGWAFVEVARRHGDYAQVGVAARLTLDGAGEIASARLVYLSVGDCPVDATHAAAFLAGETPGDEAFAAAAETAALEEIEPSGDVHASADFKRHLTRVLTVRALRTAAARALAGGASGVDEVASRSGDRFPAGARREAASGGGRTIAAGESSSLALTVNGQERQGPAEARLLLSDFLRHELDLTGTHVGCEHGVCGACTVLLDGEAVRSCLLLAAQAAGREVTTVEALAPAAGAPPGALHPLQEAFRDTHGLQCGFCTPGFLMTLVPFLAENPDPSEHEIRHALSGNLCRCTGYQNIVAAVRLAAVRAAGSTGE